MSHNPVLTNSVSHDFTGRVVAGTDLSGRAGHAVDWAAERAKDRGLPLTILLCIPEVIIPARSTVYDAMITPDFLERLDLRGQQKLASESARIRDANPGLDVTTTLLRGEPGGALIKATKTADLVVVGARGRSAPVSMPVLGGTSDALVTHAHGPVVVVPDGAHLALEGPVVVGVDDAPESLAAIRVAVDEALDRGVGLRATHGWDPVPWAADMALGWSLDNATLGSSLKQMVDDLVGPFVADHPELTVESCVSPGRPSEVLVEATEDASLLVVGSRGRGGFVGLLLGSTSREVLRGAKCPVMVIRKRPS